MRQRRSSKMWVLGPGCPWWIFHCHATGGSVYKHDHYGGPKKKWDRGSDGVQKLPGFIGTKHLPVDRHTIIGDHGEGGPYLGGFSCAELLIDMQNSTLSQWQFVQGNPSNLQYPFGGESHFTAWFSWISLVRLP